MSTVRERLRAFFVEDRNDKATSGSGMPRRQVDATFEQNTKNLIALFRAHEYKDGPRSGDRWEVVYQGTSLTTGTIHLTEHDDEPDESQRYSISVTDLTCKFTFDEFALKSWVTNAFCDAVCVPVGKTKTTDGADRVLCIKQIPWRRISIVHMSSARNIYQVINQHVAYAAKAQNVNRGKRLGRMAGPPAKRTKRADPPPVTRDPTPSSEDVPGDDDGHTSCQEMPVDHDDLDREPTPPQDDDGPPARRSVSADNPFREVFEEQSKLIALLAEQRAQNAELCKTNRERDAQMQQLIRAEQCLQLEVNALRRCESEVERKQTENAVALAKERALRQGLETRISCMEVQLQKTQAVMHSMEIEVTGLHKFLEEGAKAACRIATAYGPNARASVSAP